MSQKIKLAERVVSASRATRIAKASRLGIMVSAILTFLIFAISYYGEVVGNFTFSVDRIAQQAGISMYENSGDKEYTSRLIADKLEDNLGMTAYCGTEYSSYEVGNEVCVPSDRTLTSLDGSHNGESYIAYTFYVENAGDVPVDVEASMNMVSESKGADQAIRVRVIIDGVGITYARRQSDRGGKSWSVPGSVEPFTESFVNPDVVMKEDISYFKPGDVMKVTVVVWYEGEDADHIINIVGGGVKLDMLFTVTEIYDF